MKTTISLLISFMIITASMGATDIPIAIKMANNSPGDITIILHDKNATIDFGNKTYLSTVTDAIDIMLKTVPAKTSFTVNTGITIIITVTYDDENKFYYVIDQNDKYWLLASWSQMKNVTKAMIKEYYNKNK